ncbi:hypothetical protein [Verrucomicrobium sp. BvORR106]|uniref:hypothetical protein n=1 Tax=Verrucomicrobium sp. BvORR106 TaxID=1403819 RepID=UPI00057167D7|nr:hypothetical protein [Verrucomicrobium sp. BvORR106]
MKTASIALILATAGLVGDAAAASWPRLPSAGSQPIDLANTAIPGTVVSSSQGIGQASSLLAADPVAGSSVPVGASEVVIRLSKQYTINTARFLSDGVEGKVTVSGSADGNQWTGLGQMEIKASDRLVPVSFAGAQVKFVKLSIQASQNGVIRSLALYGSAKTSDFHLKFSESSNASGLNLADGVGGARVIYAYPTPTNAGEKEASTNVFHFPASGEKYRTVIYDLSAPRKLKQFTAIYTATPVRLEVFAFNQLAEKKDWRGKLAFDAALLDSSTPVAVGQDARGLGNIKLTPSKTVQARYIALRFELGAGGNASVGGTVSDFLQFAMLPVDGVVSLLNPTEASQHVAADGNGGFTVTGIGLNAAGEGNYESSGNEQGDEENKEDENSEDKPDIEDQKALWSQFAGNYGAFNMMTGPRGATGGAAGSVEGNGGGDGGNSGGGGDGPTININPTNPPSDTAL